MTAGVLHPDFAAALSSRPSLASLSDETLAGWRSGFPPPLVSPLSDDVVRVDHTVRPDGPIVRVHRPRDAEETLPGLLWMHGGGFVMGNRSQDDPRFDSWVARHRFVAASVEYRLAPETPYPGPLDDCFDSLLWVIDHATDLGIDVGRLGVGGASAGGGLAAGLALLVRDRGAASLAFQLLVYPMLDDRQSTPSSRAEAPLWPPVANRFGWRAYLGERWGSDAVDGYAAPARALDLTGLPAAYIAVGSLDGFVDEDVDYATRLRRAGVPTDLHVYPGAPHGFDGMAPGNATTKRALRNLHEWLAGALRP